VSARDSKNKYDREILQLIAADGRVTQRMLAARLGVALGMTNLVVRRLVDRGLVRTASPIRRYELTPTGWEALTRAKRLSLASTIDLYARTREQIRAVLHSVSEGCQATAGEKRVVFYGAGGAAEIAYVGIHRTDLTLVGVVDDFRRGQFFEFAIHHPDALSNDSLAGIPFARIIVTSVHHGDAIQQRLRERGLPPQCIWCL
jgi:DNA-binding Lrp family transcriptional regulator